VPLLDLLALLFTGAQTNFDIDGYAFELDHIDEVRQAPPWDTPLLPSTKLLEPALSCIFCPPPSGQFSKIDAIPFTEIKRSGKLPSTCLATPSSILLSLPCQNLLALWMAVTLARFIMLQLIGLT